MRSLSPPSPDRAILGDGIREAPAPRDGKLAADGAGTAGAKAGGGGQPRSSVQIQPTKVRTSKG
jgi:hypothetical protein